MAEEIRRRVAALRLAALLAVALTVAGLTTREPVRPVAGEGVPQDSVGTRQVIDNSLTADDFRSGELLTPGQAGNKFLKVDAAERTYLNQVDAAATYLQKVRAADTYLEKIEAADTYLSKFRAADLYLSKVEAASEYLLKIDSGHFLLKQGAADVYLSKIDAAREYFPKVEVGGLLHKEQAADLYLSKIEAARDYLLKVDAEDFVDRTYADETFLKIGAQVDAYKLGGRTADQFVQGDGSVLTGLVLLDGSEGRLLMDLPGVGRLLATDNGERAGARLENHSGGMVLVTYDGTSQELPGGGATMIAVEPDRPTLVQLVSLERGLVSTVTLTASTLGDTQLLSGQALVGR